MTARPRIDTRPVTGPAADVAWARTDAVTILGIVDLGPFVVRRFVDFARTESMMCRVSA